MSDSANDVDRLLDLADAVYDETASENEFAEMDTLLIADDQSRSRYLSYCWMHAAIKLELRAHRAAQRLQRHIDCDMIPLANAGDAPEAETPSPLPLGVLGDTIHGASGYFASGWPVAYLIATVIFGIGLVIGAVVHVSPPVPFATNDPRNMNTPSATQSAVAARVGRITGMIDCVWEGSGARVRGSGESGQDGSGHHPLSAICLGDRIALKSGLLEITYNTGAKAILQGPVTYEVDSAAGGYLAVGKLTAKLEKRSAVSGQRSGISSHKSEISNPSPLFSVRTPTATVTDLGTEFGVEVDKSGETTSHVFRGSVRLETTSDTANNDGTTQVLHEGESARVTTDGKNRIALLGSSTASTPFVRALAQKANERAVPFELVAYWQFDGNGFLADSSGNGHSLVKSGATQLENTALFNGNAAIHTVDSVDLTAYGRIRMSWSMKAASAAESDQILWEHGHNYSARAGAIIAYLSNTNVMASIRTDDKTYNRDEIPVSVGTWQHFVVEFNLVSDRGGRAPYRRHVVKIIKDGALIGADTRDEGVPLDSFINAPFHIGARARAGESRPSTHLFIGQLDNLKIEGALKSVATSSATTKTKSP